MSAASPTSPAAKVPTPISSIPEDCEAIGDSEPMKTKTVTIETRQLSEWHDVEPTTEDAVPGDVMKTRAEKIHQVFSKLAIPCAFIIGLFFVLLLLRAEIEPHTVGRVLASFATATSCVLTTLLVYLHLATYTNPDEQRRVIRILLMVPIYAVDSLLALWNYEHAEIIGLARDCYESYVIYTFFRLLMSYLGGENAALRIAESIPPMSHMFPLCCLEPFLLSASSFRVWKILLVQYMVLKPFLSFVAIFLTVTGQYGDKNGEYFSVHAPYLYFTIILNISVTAAFTSLVYFFVAFKEALAPRNPKGKFIAVKAVVFLSFWQGVLLQVLVHAGVVKGSREGLWTQDEVSTGVQDFLICIEMLFISLAHRWVFPETDYLHRDGVGYRRVPKWAVLHMLSLRDVVEETVDTITAASEVARPRKPSPPPRGDSSGVREAVRVMADEELNNVPNPAPAAGREEVVVDDR